jgi:Flp pilus assembly protein TadG
VLLRLPARARSQAGAELVEFALVLPMLLLIFGGIVDFGMLLQRQQVVTNAAREGARIAVLPGYCLPDVQARVTGFVRAGLSNNSLTPATARNLVDVPVASGPALQAYEVEVTLPSSFMILGPIVSLAGGSGASFGTIVIRAKSTMRIETVPAEC